MMIISGLDVGSLDATVTEMVGAIDGVDESSLIGFSVGYIVEFGSSINNGLLVGSAVGCGIVDGGEVDVIKGASVGIIVGGVVGSKEGLFDGTDVGKAEGFLVVS